MYRERVKKWFSWSRIPIKMCGAFFATLKKWEPPPPKDFSDENKKAYAEFAAAFLEKTEEEVHLPEDKSPAES